MKFKLFSLKMPILETVDLVIFASLDFFEIVISGLFVKSRIRELLISMMYSRKYFSAISIDLKG